jgi:predicted DNA-binding transcriptional regulator AlpA
MKSDLDLLDRRGACRLFGEIHVATLYRHVRAGLIPKPIHVSGSSRWLRSECEAALARMIEVRQ